MERPAILKVIGGRGGPAGPVGLAAGLLAVSLSLGGCAKLDTLFQGDAVPNERVVADVDPEQQDYPNLASVPDQPPRPLPLVERKRVTEGLVSDRGRARFSDQPLTPQLAAAPSTEVSPPLQEPPPPPQAPPEWSTPAPVEPLASDQPPAPIVESAKAEGGGQLELLGVVSFVGGSESLGADDLQVLQDIVAVHAERGGGLMVVGQSSGRVAAAISLDQSLASLERSAKRADQVAGELVALGVDSSQLQVAANAEIRRLQIDPILNSQVGNRRVEIYLID
jgi:flagellar motor protein MotB